MIRRARGDDALTSCVATRSDLPPQRFDHLLATASEKVRAKLQSEREYARSEIDTVVGEVAGKIHTAAATQPISYAAAQVLVETMHRAGLLTAGKLQEFAVAGRFEEMVATLSLMSDVPTAVIEQNMRDTQHHDAGGKTVSSFAGGGRPGDARVSSSATVNRATNPRLSSHAEPACLAALRHFA